MKKFFKNLLMHLSIITTAMFFMNTNNVYAHFSWLDSSTPPEGMTKIEDAVITQGSGFVTLMLTVGVLVSLLSVVIAFFYIAKPTRSSKRDEAKELLIRVFICVSLLCGVCSLIGLFAKIGVALN